MRRLLLLALLATLATELPADERYEFPGQDWGRRPFAGHANNLACQPPRRNFGAVNLNPQRVTRRPNPNLLFRGGGWGYPWGYYFPYAWGYYAPWGWGPFWGGWGFGNWGLGFNSWSYRFGFAGGGGPAPSASPGWTPGPTRLSDGWYVGPQGMARQVSHRRPPRGSLPLPTYEGCYYW